MRLHVPMRALPQVVNQRFDANRLPIATLAASNSWAQTKSADSRLPSSHSFAKRSPSSNTAVPSSSGSFPCLEWKSPIGKWKNNFPSSCLIHVLKYGTDFFVLNTESVVVVCVIRVKRLIDPSKFVRVSHFGRKQNCFCFNSLGLEDCALDFAARCFMVSKTAMDRLLFPIFLELGDFRDKGSFFTSFFTSFFILFFTRPATMLSAWLWTPRLGPPHQHHHDHWTLGVTTPSPPS